MAKKGTGFFDRKGHFFKNARDATVSDIASLLGQIGEGESLAPGIAHLLLEKRSQLEILFAEHDAMEGDADAIAALAEASDKVAKLPERPKSESA